MSTPVLYLVLWVLWSDGLRPWPWSQEQIVIAVSAEPRAERAQGRASLWRSEPVAERAQGGADQINKTTRLCILETVQIAADVCFVDQFPPLYLSILDMMISPQVLNLERLTRLEANFGAAQSHALQRDTYLCPVLDNLKIREAQL